MSQLISKEYINNEIINCTPTDTVFKSSYFEAINFDVNPKLCFDVEEEYNEDNIPERLKRAIAYYTISRIILNNSANITKYGYVQKMEENGMSQPASDRRVHDDSNIWKNKADELIRAFKSTCCKKDDTFNTTGPRLSIIGD